ncbi:MAG: sulfur carrier protein ThiS [Pirellulales bacterium]|jgi:thiamine biosynthesis protein ThiS|nr:sulfur carrier protein ThiS [Pirellulales bacterium]
MNIILNGQVQHVVDSSTVADLLDTLDVPLRGFAVEVNGELVPRKSHGDYRLAANDRLEIVTLVGGG